MLMQEILRTTVPKLAARSFVRIRTVLVELLACAEPAFAARDEGLLVVDSHLVETNAPFHVGVHDLPKVITRTEISLLKILVGSDLYLRHPNRLFSSNLNRHICHDLGVGARRGGTGVFALSNNPSSHFAHLCDWLLGDPAVGASSESLRVDRFTTRTLSPPAVHLTLVFGDVLIGWMGIGICAMAGRGVSHDLSVDEIWFI